MKVIYGLGRLKEPFPRSVVAIGIFDGVHRGHQYLLRQTVRKAKAISGTSVVVTFFPHPVQVLRSRKDFFYLLSLEHRLKLLSDIGIDVCFVLRFSRRFARLSPEDFFQQHLLKRISPREILVGQNFKFGRNRAGDVQVLKWLGEQEGIPLKALAPRRNAQQIISSSVIREKILRGDLKSAAIFLGRPFSSWAQVHKGKRRGVLLGFPTANITPDPEIILPEYGVYAVKVQYAGRLYEGMANVGHSPSFSSSASRGVEVHLFDYHGNLYQQKIEVQFFKKIRNTRVFSTAEALSAQLARDRMLIREYFKRQSSWR